MTVPRPRTALPPPASLIRYCPLASSYTPRTPRPGVPVHLLTMAPVGLSSYRPKLPVGVLPLAASSTLPLLRTKISAGMLLMAAGVKAPE